MNSIQEMDRVGERSAWWLTRCILPKNRCPIFTPFWTGFCFIVPFEGFLMSLMLILGVLGVIGLPGGFTIGFLGFLGCAISGL